MPQNDIMYANLTVFETLVFTTRLRRPLGIEKARQLNAVARVISQLRLDDVQHAIIGDEASRGISTASGDGDGDGGEKTSAAAALGGS